MVDLVQRRVFVAGVRLTDDAVGRVDARDQRRAMCHVVVTALEVGAEFGPDRDRLDTGNRQRGLTLPCEAIKFLKVHYISPVRQSTPTRDSILCSHAPSRL